METVKALAARHRQRKPRRPRRILSWQYLQRRVEQGHYNLMKELAVECPQLYKNFTKFGNDIFNEVVERVRSPHSKATHILEKTS
ncbi:hypothetical protein E2C01_054679 [Portunus trituberculatus]|uniref:Uncharacterized protein n=1 Tax=Portunus trituberculatus TaxID=210409 RepID=A0A5B7GSN7_PORTR|nr:hypothetical protein [Portunus trituberculatus]